MLILLPPSETKRAGGRARPLDVEALALPVLAPVRTDVIGALVELSRDPVVAERVLGLGATQHGEITVNANVETSPTMPAIDRYTGVLYDALDAASLDTSARRYLARTTLIHSAPFGPVGALDPIPAYRLGAGASVPGLPPLRRLWADPVTAALVQLSPSFVLDLRSEAYVRLGPLPTSVAGAYVRVVTEGTEGAVRALNHFNKHAKGTLVRRLALERPRIGSRAGFLRWTESAGIRTDHGDRGDIRLFA